MSATIAEDSQVWEQFNVVRGHRLTLAYVVCLTIIGILSLGAHYFVLEVIQQQKKSSAVINLSGRQRMLSQRIAFLSMEYGLKFDAQLREQLETAIDEMARAHERLTLGDETGGVPRPGSPQLKKLYFTPLSGIDPLVRSYIADARLLLQIVPNRQEILASAVHKRIVEAASNQLLVQLNSAVLEYERQNVSAVEDLRQIQTALLLVLVVVLLGEALLVFRPLAAKLHQFAQALARMAMHDWLTGLLNRRSLHEAASRLAAMQSRREMPLSVWLVDIDHFKRINDQHGHGGGDLVLKRVATVLAESMRTEDCAARWGGEEFAILLAGADEARSMEAAQRMRVRIANTEIDLPSGTKVKVSVSIGVSRWNPSVGDSFEAALDRADKALYRAKAEGRNEVRAEDAYTSPSLRHDLAALDTSFLAPSAT
ncbi:diguanylate cyclase [Rhodoferax sp. GW822-FHT02A01]|uniref:diguanylate cyclase n=1 Tax=Rhodoferax sp. GW822-FHT02A01 TaxID=3141537 RepID=UPI00315C8EB7